MTASQPATRYAIWTLLYLCSILLLAMVFISGLFVFFAVALKDAMAILLGGIVQVALSSVVGLMLLGSSRILSPYRRYMPLAESVLLFSMWTPFLSDGIICLCSFVFIFDAKPFPYDLLVIALALLALGGVLAGLHRKLSKTMRIDASN